MFARAKMRAIYAVAVDVRCRRHYHCLSATGRAFRADERVGVFFISFTRRRHRTPVRERLDGMPDERHCLFHFPTSHVGHWPAIFLERAECRYASLPY